MEIQKRLRQSVTCFCFLHCLHEALALNTILLLLSARAMHWVHPDLIEWRELSKVLNVSNWDPRQCLPQNFMRDCLKYANGQQPLTIGYTLIVG